MPPSRAKKRDDYYRDRRRRKVCAFCADKTPQIDYKEVSRLRRYLSERAEDRAAPQDRHLRRPPARAGGRPEAGTARGAAAVRPAAPAALISGPRAHRPSSG